MRYQESGSGDDALVKYCEKFIPENEADPLDIGPDFDVNMDLLGWFKPGQKLQLEIVGKEANGQNIYKDHRQIQRYYKKHDGKFLNAFEPLY